MGGVDWPTVAAVIAIIMAMLGIVKYVGYLISQHKENVDDKFIQVHGRFKDQGNRIEANKHEIKRVSDRVTETREEMKADYVRHADLDRQLDEHKSILNAIFDRINRLSNDVNQMIGAQNGKFISKEEDDIGQ